jgi:D-alanyl-D-alanine carboxypeptidase (penicillin-binding protein 5/6)
MSAGPGRRASAVSLKRIALLCVAFLCAAAGIAPLAQAAPRLSVRAAILTDATTGKKLYGVDPYRSLPIASTTKLMTALVTLEHARLQRRFTEPNFYFPPADSQIGLVPGERMSVHDLLIGLLLPSGDDAAEDLAYNVGRRSVARFIGMMNARARELGLRHTHYASATGLDTPGNYSSASDLVKLASYVLSTQAFFAKVVAWPHAVLRTGNHHRSVSNRNDLVARYSWVNGVKTGHTSQAGYVLVALGERHGMRLLSAVLGTTSESARDANTLELLGYGFSHFHLVTAVRRNQVLARPTVKDSPGKHAVVVAAKTFTRVLARNTHVRIVVQLPHQLSGPKAYHAVVGTVQVVAGHRTLARIPLLLAQRLPAVSPLTLAAHFITRTSTLVLLALVCLLVIAWFGWRRLRLRQPSQEGAEPA